MTLSQTDAQAKFMPIIRAFGDTYAKKGVVLARKAVEGEVVHTHTSDGKETENKARPGDFVLRNPTAAGEEYIVPEDTLRTRYILIGDSDIDGWLKYKPLGKCEAAKYEGSDTEFIASWGSPMVLKRGDMICTPLPARNEVYRIAAKEFSETYEICK